MSHSPHARVIDFMRFSVSLVTQGKRRFYTLTMPSDILSDTCFVTTRYDDPKEGFQRRLDKKRAQEIADYIDTGLGTIPNSIVLSAQPEAELRVIGRGKTLEFRRHNKAFLVLDGQHRVYGFSLAKTTLRVPVVIYNGLSRMDESRLFIDINTKQRPVPNELLLDIRKLAEYESDVDRLMGEIFDSFSSETGSPLKGLMSPAERSRGKISRVTFNAALKPLVTAFQDSEPTEIYGVLSSYLTAFIRGADKIKATGVITKPPVFRAALLLFKEVGQRVQDKHGKHYTVDTFTEVMEPMFARTRAAALRNPPASHKALCDSLSSNLKQNFVI